MKYLDEYRDAGGARRLVTEIRRAVTRPWCLMEVCGGQTHAILRFGIDQLLPSEVTLIHGPGCPVCVTPIEVIDKSLAIAARPEVIFCSFGDMLRVPGTGEDLLTVKARGGDVRIVYSPTDAVSVARENPSREVVFFAVGFETTAPATAMAVAQAAALGLKNFSLLVSHVLVLPAMEALLHSRDCRVQGFLAAGHVCAITGWKDYQQLVAKYRVPVIVTGFEPLDLLHGILLCVQQLERGQSQVENQYTRAVCRDGNPAALDLMREVFRVSARNWRGLGPIPDSGLALNERYALFDAEHRFGPVEHVREAANECLSGRVLQGLLKPWQCPAFGTRCTPERPLGATMVSSEGACAAYHRYRSSGETLV